MSGEVHEWPKGWEEALQGAASSSRPYYDAASTMHLPDGFPRQGMAARHCKSICLDQHTLDCIEKLNTSTYVNVVQEPEEEDVALMGLKINLADQTVYPQSFEVHDRCVTAVAKLWHAPEGYSGAGTLGSTEACLLAGIALKFRWRGWYARRVGAKSSREIFGVVPNLVISTMYQAVWEKFFKFFDVEPRFIAPSIKGADFHGKGWRIDPERVVQAVDEHTIGVVCIMGTHYSGHYDRVAEVDAKLQKLNKDKGYQVGIHVDAASGGFVAPFQRCREEQGDWDFALPTVLSMSASGHKFGQSCCGTGWVVFRSHTDLAEHVAVSVGYLGGKADSLTLNFSRPATGVYVQYYKILRLGFEGFARLTDNMMAVATFIRRGLLAMKRAKDGAQYFQSLDALGAHGCCLPVVSARLNPDLADQIPFDDIDLQHAIAQYKWYVSGYKLSFEDPLTKELKPLFIDESPDATMFRIVVKANLSMPMATHLLKSIEAALAYLEAHGDGFTSHPGHKYHHGAQAAH